MTEISAKMICHSVGRHAPPLSTMKLRYPRSIHAELMTHRVFSRNARSSRAVPIAKMIEEAESGYAMPLHWGKAQAGMQAYEELTGVALAAAQDSWHRARRYSIQEAKTMAAIGLAKQNVNRILEPYIHIETLLTATELANWYGLRDHAHAEPHIAILARAIRECCANSEPQMLDDGVWHLPYITDEDHERLDLSALRMISAARCARISYKAYDGSTPDYEADIALAEKLARDGHWSPFEHQAKPDNKTSIGRLTGDWRFPALHGNLKGWIQHRKLFHNESGTEARAA